MEDPDRKTTPIFPKPEDGTASEDNREGSYFQNIASQHAFASIEAVDDLGFKRQADASNANSQRSDSSQPQRALQDPSQSNVSSVHSSGDETAQSRLLRRLRESQCKSKDSDKEFIPFCEIERILSREAVQEVLKQVIDSLSSVESEAELEKLTEDICGVPSRRRLFALLIRAEQADCIRCFVEYGVDDTDFPFAPSPEISAPVVVYPRSDTGYQKGLDCFGTWTISGVEWLLDRQHAVAPPFFDLTPGRLLHYTLPKDAILPFTESEDAGVGGLCKRPKGFNPSGTSQLS